MNGDREDYIRAHEDLIRAYLERRPWCSEEHAYKATRPDVTAQMLRNHCQRQQREQFLNRPVNKGE